MKKREIFMGLAILILALSLLAFFSSYFKLDFITTKMIVAILTVLAGGLLLAINRDLDNKTLKLYNLTAAGLLILLGFLPILVFLQPYNFALSLPLIIPKIILFLGSVFVLISSLK